MATVSHTASGTQIPVSGVTNLPISEHVDTIDSVNIDRETAGQAFLGSGRVTVTADIGAAGATGRLCAQDEFLHTHSQVLQARQQQEMEHLNCRVRQLEAESTGLTDTLRRSGKVWQLEVDNLFIALDLARKKRYAALLPFIYKSRY